VLFFEVPFVDLIDPANAGQYIAGLILLGAAPCTAMVFVWSQLTRGDANYTLVQVSLNDVIMIFAFAPIVALLLGVTDIVGAVGDAAAVGGAVRGDPADRRGHHADAADRERAAPGAARREAESRASPRGSSRCRCSACWPRWCCCSASRAGSSSTSRC
jgi:hypothetical protein